MKATTKMALASLAAIIAVISITSLWLISVNDKIQSNRLANDLIVYSIKHNRQLPSSWVDFAFWARTNEPRSVWSVHDLARRFSLSPNGVVPMTVEYDSSARQVNGKVMFWMKGILPQITNSVK